MRPLLLLLALLAGCGAKRGNQCPTNVTGKCAFNDEECSYDKEHDCQVCQCKGLQDPKLTQPDDHNLPPEPVH